ncbi:MAG: hypothetical protein JRI49_06950 [Deltaproteobacteria bacterium]|nr:hypothetical protein [Deltaproteobacteria bacterium]
MKEQSRTLTLTDTEFTILLNILHQVDQNITSSQKEQKITFPFKFDFAIRNIFSAIVSKARAVNIYRMHTYDSLCRKVKR